MRLWQIYLILTLALAGCSAPPPDSDPSREPAEVLRDAGLTRNEEKICANYQCRHFVAPCSLMDSKRNRAVSLVGQRYIEDGRSYADLGYCQRPPRPISSTSYGEGTCMYLFVRSQSACH